MFRIGKLQVGFVAGKLTSAACFLKRPAREIDSGGLHARFEPLQVISAHANTDLQHSQFAGLTETGKLRDVRLQRVAYPGMVLEILRGFQVAGAARDRKSTRLNSSHRCISYAV